MRKELGKLGFSVVAVSILAVAGWDATPIRAKGGSHALGSRNSTSRVSTPASVAAMSDSGLVVPDVTLQNRDGRAHLEIRGRLALGSATTRILWFVDKREQTYQVFILDDPEIDAGNIVGYLSSRGVNASVDQIKARLQASRDRTEAEREVDRQRGSNAPIRSRRHQQQFTSLSAAMESPNDGPDGSGAEGFGDDWWCDGSTFAMVEVQEIAIWGLQLPVSNLATTKIKIRTAAGYSGGYWNDSYVDNGSTGCWANDNTFISTSWWQVSCNQSDGYTGWGFDSLKAGRYYNTDFGYVMRTFFGLPVPDAYTEVYTEASASYSDYAGPGYYAYYEESADNGYGENWLLDGALTTWTNVMCWY